MTYLLAIVFIGTVATAATDIWGLIRKSLLGVAPPNFGLVGRWIGHMPKGRFRHEPIAASAAIPGELILGWAIHYLIGILFAALLIGIWGPSWIQQPTVGPALVVGVGTVLAPFLLMQPGMGAGVAASKTPNPAMARLHSIITHTIFGLGLYAAGWAFSLLLAG